jgi:hypothetical protein
LIILKEEKTEVNSASSVGRRATPFSHGESRPVHILLLGNFWIPGVLPVFGLLLILDPDSVFVLFSSLQRPSILPVSIGKSVCPEDCGFCPSFLIILLLLPLSGSPMFHGESRNFWIPGVLAMFGLLLILYPDSVFVFFSPLQHPSISPVSIGKSACARKIVDSALYF